VDAVAAVVPTGRRGTPANSRFLTEKRLSTRATLAIGGLKTQISSHEGFVDVAIRDV
jgi:hypothetical protein